MPQLTMITSGKELSLKRRWPYQAKVMKKFDANSMRIGSRAGEIFGMHFPYE
jgi:hypothetical protein